MNKLLFPLLLLTLMCQSHAGGKNTWEPQEESVLRPHLTRLFVGPFGGVGLNLHIGDFETQCDCIYSGGTGFGPVGGIVVELPVSENWFLSGIIMYQDMRATFERTERRLEYGQTGEFVDIEFEQRAEVNLSYFGLLVQGKWRPGWRGLYISIGPALAFTGEDHLKETERILTPGWVYKKGLESEQIFTDSGIPAKRGIRIAAHASAGYDFVISPRFTFTPEIGFQFPLTSISSADSDWSVASIHTALYFKFGL